MKILLAEDDRYLANALSNALREASHTVDVVHDGFQALDKVRNDEYACLIIECNLPRAPAELVSKEAKARGMRCVCMLSASHYEGENVGWFDLVLPKPFGVDGLLTAIDRLGASVGKETYGFVTLDYERSELSYKGKAVCLTLPEMMTTRAVAKEKQPVSACEIAQTPLALVEGSVFKTIALINAKLVRAGLGLRLVAESDKGYRVNYD